MANDERSPGGSAIYRHAARERDWEPASGDPEAMEAIEEHIACHIGPVETVYHELVSDMVHIDVHIVPPQAQHPYYTLITSGMSARPMRAPPGLEDWRYAELLICLPPTWPLQQEDLKHEAHYWPIRWLKRLARLPHEYDTWLGPSHTVPSGDPAQPFAPTTRLCCALISQPLRFGDEVHLLEVGPAKAIHFLSFVPLYREEMEHKLQHGIDALYDRLDAIGVTELLDVGRKNACARRFGWW